MTNEIIKKQQDVVQQKFLEWESHYYKSIKAYNNYTQELMALTKIIEEQNSNQLKLEVQ